MGKQGIWIDKKLTWRNEGDRKIDKLANRAVRAEGVREGRDFFLRHKHIVVPLTAFTAISFCGGMTQSTTHN